MTQSPPALKRCPRCRRPLAERSVICRFCLTDVRTTDGAVEELSDSPLTAKRRSLREQARALQPRWLNSRKRVALAVVALLFVALIGRQAYGWWFSHPSVLPLASTTLSLEAGPTTWPLPSGGIRGWRAADVDVDLDATEAWTINLDATLLGAPVADEEHLYLVVRDRLVALRRSDGSEAWSLTAPGIFAPPSVAGGRVFLAVRNGRVLALDAAAGEELWSVATGTEVFVTPVLDRGTLYVFGLERLHGIDAADGRLLWDVDTGSRSASIAPAIASDRIALAVRSSILQLDRETGEEAFRSPHASATGLFVDDIHVYSVSPGFAAAVALDAEQPWWEGMRGKWNRIWAFGLGPEPPRPEVDWVSRERPSALARRVASAEAFTPAFNGTTIAATDTSGVVRAFSAADGSLLWETDLEAGHGPPLFVTGGLLVPLRDALVLLDLTTGEEISRRALPPLNEQDLRWIVAVEGETFVVDGPGQVLALR